MASTSRSRTSAQRRSSSGRSHPPAKRRRKKNSGRGALMLLIVLFLIMLVMAILLIGQKSQDNKEIRTALARTTFFDGIYVDDVHLGGMTYDQAETTLTRILGARDFDGSIIITHKDQIWEANQEDLSLDYDLTQVLDEAYAIGRDPEKSDKENYAALRQLKITPARFSITTQLGISGLSDLVADIAAQVDVPARNAAFMGFGNGAQFSQEENGLKVDQELLKERILQQIQNNDFPTAIEVPTIVTTPEITVTQLEASCKRIVRFTSTATSDKTRNNNIKLALSAINGTVLKPGEVFSMNDTTGERTDAKGYQPAGAIRNGILIQELGGGVCQVSTTIFNAVARADLKIVERNPHTWPSSYVEKGQDAMVDYPSSDFKFENTTGSDLYICCWFDDSSHTIYVELYGMPILADGTTIELRTEILETIPQPEDVVKESSALPAGAVEETRTGRTGYRVRCYKQYVTDGKVVSEEKLCDSYYAAIAAIFTIGPAVETQPDPVVPEIPVIPELPADTSEPLG